MNTVGPRVPEVIIAAGGLGTRVRGWSSILPKEFYPINGQPGIVHLLNEVTRLGPARVIIVHHPYYAPFVTWARHTLSPAGERRYRHAAGLPAGTTTPALPTDLTWIQQHGPYADLTSVFNGAHHIRGDPFYVAFADNLYPDAEPLAALSTVDDNQVAVLARPYHRAQASERGVVIARRLPAATLMLDLIEKPSIPHALHLEDRYGPDNLFLLEGRFRLTNRFIRFAHGHTHPQGEPKLSLTLREFARRHPVRIVTIDSTVTDLGTHPPGCPARVNGAVQRCHRAPEHRHAEVSESCRVRWKTASRPTDRPVASTTSC